MKPKLEGEKRAGRMAAALVATAAIAGALLAGSAVAQGAGASLKSLGGEQVLNQTNAAPTTEKQSVPAGGFGRAYRQQPPMIPHKVDGYQVTPTNNACMECHDWPGHIKAKAPKVSETHYVDRQGVRLDKIAGTRYFCQQCHVPQVDAPPLVGNVFQNATQAK